MYVLGASRSLAGLGLHSYGHTPYKGQHTVFQVWLEKGHDEPPMRDIVTSVTFFHVTYLETASKALLAVNSPNAAIPPDGASRHFCDCTPPS